jgi:hypothetical protein
MKMSEMKLLQPNQEVEFAEEIAGDEVFRLQVKLEQDQKEALDPASYVEHRWVERGPNQYSLMVKNWTGSPVYVAIEDPES